MMLYTNLKAMVLTSHEYADLFNIVAGVLQGNILVPYLFINCQDYELLTSIEQVKNSLTLNEIKSKWYPIKTLTNFDYTDDLRFLAYTPAKRNPYYLP